MLALIAIFLFTVVVSAAAVWLYRRVSGWQGFTATVVGRPNSTTRMKIGLQQGFISMVPNGGGRTKNVRLRTPRGGIKTPWGW
jgi:hypothetical protein